MSTLHGRHSLNHKYHNSLERQDLSVRALEVTPLSLLRSEGEHSFCRLCPWSAHRPDGFSLQAFPPRGEHEWSFQFPSVISQQHICLIAKFEIAYFQLKRSLHMFEVLEKPFSLLTTSFSLVSETLCHLLNGVLETTALREWFILSTNKA